MTNHVATRITIPIEITIGYILPVNMSIIIPGTKSESQRCDAQCMREILPFDVPNLADLCGRNDAIKRGYRKCDLV